MWSLTNGNLIRDVHGTGDTFDVSWSHDGTMLCSCFSSGSLHVLDVSKQIDELNGVIKAQVSTGKRKQNQESNSDEDDLDENGISSNSENNEMDIDDTMNGSNNLDKDLKKSKVEVDNMTSISQKDDNTMNNIESSIQVVPTQESPDPVIATAE